MREEAEGGEAVESTGGVPPWGSGANRPPLEDDDPVKKLLRELNYKEERRRLRTGPPMFGEGTTQAPE